MVMECGLGTRLALIVMCLKIIIVCLWSDMWPGKELGVWLSVSTATSGM